MRTKPFLRPWTVNQKEEMVNMTQEQTNAKGETPDKLEEKRSRNYFLRLFGSYDFRDERQFILFFKVLLYILLVLVEVLMLWQQMRLWGKPYGGILYIVLLACSGGLALLKSLQLFVFRHSGKETIFSVFNMLCSCCILFVADGTHPITIYIIILSELYIGAPNIRASFIVFGVVVPLYAGCYTAKNLVISDLGLTGILQDAFGAALALFMHFIILHIALAFYRQYLRLHRTLQELDHSKKELEKAYAVVAEVTALEERQRIAKEIHDTAGHSLTTVIMQTEAAKRIVEDNPAEAKSKIVAANLQAKHALEELRDSVHLLSGNTAKYSLKTAFEKIIHESTDGTGITIRSHIEDTALSDAKFRFLCNTLKEGLSNGLRHGGATAFWFEFKEEDGKLQFLLSDNGKGVKGEVQFGFGLASMQDRAKALGGEIFFDAEENEGVELRVTLPADTQHNMQ